MHLAARTGRVRSLRYEQPFFLFNDTLAVMLKYSTGIRSPWAFTFTPEEQEQLQKSASGYQTAIGLICGADGVAALTYESFLAVAAPREAALHLACFRRHGEHYELSGPDGKLKRKIAPSNWQKILENHGGNGEALGAGFGSVEKADW